MITDIPIIITGDLVEPTEDLDPVTLASFVEHAGPPPWEVVDFVNRCADHPQLQNSLWQYVAIGLMPAGVKLSSATSHHYCRWVNNVNIVKGNEILPVNQPPMKFPFRLARSAAVGPIEVSSVVPSSVVPSSVRPAEDTDDHQ